MAVICQWAEKHNAARIFFFLFSKSLSLSNTKLRSKTIGEVSSKTIGEVRSKTIGEVSSKTIGEVRSKTKRQS